MNQSSSKLEKALKEINKIVVNMSVKLIIFENKKINCYLNNDVVFDFDIISGISPNVLQISLGRFLYALVKTKHDWIITNQTSYSEIVDYIMRMIGTGLFASYDHSDSIFKNFSHLKEEIKNLETQNNTLKEENKALKEELELHPESKYVKENLKEHFDTLVSTTMSCDAPKEQN